MCSVIQGIVQGKARALQEAVVEDVCQQLLQLDPRVSAVQVYMRKPHVALAGVLDSVGGYAMPLRLSWLGRWHRVAHGSAAAACVCACWVCGCSWHMVGWGQGAVMGAGAKSWVAVETKAHTRTKKGQQVLTMQSQAMGSGLGLQCLNTVQWQWQCAAQCKGLVCI